VASQFMGARCALAQRCEIWRYLMRRETPCFAKNLIGSVCWASVALLVASANCAKFECAVSRNGVMKTHVAIARAMGINDIVVCVSKCDVLRERRSGWPRVAASLTARIVLLALAHPVEVGYTPAVHCHTASVSCRFAELVAHIDKRTGKVIEEHPSSVAQGWCALVRLVPLKPLCVEEFRKGCRFVIMHSHRLVGVGVVEDVQYGSVAADEKAT
jgi:translation elongation factor EF-1alpha